MNKKILHTPEGVRDIYPIECRKKLVLQNTLHKTIQSYGYQDIQTPTLEFSEVFSKEIGSIESNELYRFFDRDGNILVLRPDITPSIARAISTTLNENDPLGKFCYTGNTFINHNSYQGRLKENTQLGAETIGIDSVESDAEMIAMVVDVLQSARLEEFQVSMSHVDYFNALMTEAHLQSETDETLRDLYENKNYFGVNEVLDKCEISKELANAFRILPDLIGGVEIFPLAKEVAPNQVALEAIERLENIAKVLDMYGVLNHITFDLSMSGTYGYYTGIIFRAFTFGIGGAIVKGGRYNQLLQHFGKHVPAIGFAITIDDLFNAISRQKIALPHQLDNYVILYDDCMTEKAIRLATNFRFNNRVTELIKKEPHHDINFYIEYAKRNFGNCILYLKADYTAQAINLLDDSEQIINLKVK